MKSEKTPITSLMGELWVAFSEFFVENIPRDIEVYDI